MGDALELSVPEDCGNSPRKKFLVEFNRAFAECNVAYVLEHVSDEIVWDMVGNKVVSGIAAMRQELETIAVENADSLTLHSVITHGREAAANGEMHFPGGNHVAFCDVYTFTKTTGNTLKRITSYGINFK